MFGMRMKGNQFVRKQMRIQTTRIFIFKFQKYLNLGLQSKHKSRKNTFLRELRIVFV